MRVGVGALVFVVALGVALAGEDAVATRKSCEPRSAPTRLRLPAAVRVTTSCGAFVISRDGRAWRTSTDPSPVPHGASWWPYTGVWDKVVRGRLIIGRWKKRLWRSSRTFSAAYDVGEIAVGRHALVFSYDDRTPHLYLAALGGSERQIATGEYPVGWTRGGFYTRRPRRGALLFRSAGGRREETLARGVWRYAYDHASGSIYFITDGMLVRADGRAQRPIAALRELGFSGYRDLQLQPLGKLIAVDDARRLVVLHASGAPFAETPLPRRRARVDGISSQLTVAPSTQAVAFTATSGNTAAGSHGTETVYVLRPGDRRARLVHEERMSFAICERGASLAWHGRWLLYGASEGNTAVIDTARPREAIELTRLVRHLPGRAGAEGNLDLSLSWGSASRTAASTVRHTRSIVSRTSLHL